MRRPTREDVAREAGTSTAVVTYVLNAGPRPVAPETRRRVLEAIKKVNYRPNRVAQALASGKTGTVGLVVPNITNPFIGEIAHTIESLAFSSRRVLLVGDSADDRNRERELIANFLSQQVDGVIYMGVIEELALDLFDDVATPVVVFTWADSDGRCPSVRIDERRAVAALTDHLLYHGYTDIAMMTGPSHMRNSELRRDGWRDAMSAAELEASDDAVSYVPYSRFAAYSWAMEKVKSGRLPRALVTGNERQAVGILAALADCGVRVPDEVAIAALNGSADAGFAVPSLTSIRQPFAEMAQTAFEMLDHPDDYPPQGVTFGFDLVVGQSCGCFDERRPDRTMTASWTTPDASSLDSAAGMGPVDHRPKKGA